MNLKIRHFGSHKLASWRKLVHSPAVVLAVCGAGAFCNLVLTATQTALAEDLKVPVISAHGSNRSAHTIRDESWLHPAAERAIVLNGARVVSSSYSTPLGVKAALEQASGCAHGQALFELQLEQQVGAGVCRDQFEVSAEHSVNTVSGPTAQHLRRYVFAQRNAETTSVFSFEFDQANQDAMFPEAGDVPGADPTDIPRPLASRRVLSVALEDRSQTTHLYHSRLSLTELEKAEERGMLANGWQRAARDPSHSGMQLYAKAGREAILTFEARDGQTEVLITTLEAPL